MTELLKITGLKKSYGSNRVLDGIDLTVNKGETVVIVGPSGCGKSTLLRCINALEEHDSGEILIDGQPVQKGKSLSAVRAKTGMVFQSYELFPHLDILNNITLAPCKVQKRNKKDAEEEARELLERVGLSEKAKSYPKELSGGQKQRVAIVRR